MSADNGILVKKIGRKWYVKDNACFSVDHTDKYIKDTKHIFSDRVAALIAAHDLARGNYYEYGVSEI